MKLTKINNTYLKKQSHNCNTENELSNDKKH